MKRRTDGRHAGGRPKLQDAKSITYFSDLLKNYETLTQAELAERYHVSRTTICKHIKIAREVVDSGRV